MLALHETCKVKQRARLYLCGRLVSETQPDKWPYNIVFLDKQIEICAVLKIRPTFLTILFFQAMEHEEAFPISKAFISHLVLFTFLQCHCFYLSPVFLFYHIFIAFISHLVLFTLLHFHCFYLSPGIIHFITSLLYSGDLKSDHLKSGNI